MRIYEIVLMIFGDLSFILIFAVCFTTSKGVALRKTSPFKMSDDE